MKRLVVSWMVSALVVLLNGCGGGNGVPTAPPSIVSAPANATVTAGGTASFTVLATGIPLPNTFAWGLGGSVIPATGGTVRIGATAMACTATATFAVASSAPAGQVGQTLTLSNIGAGCDRAAVQVTAFSTLPGGGTLDASASARLAVVDPWVAPAVSLAPATQTGSLGGSISVTGTATGNPVPGAFVWGVNGFIVSAGLNSLGGCTANASFAPAPAPNGQSAQTLTLSNLGPGCNNAQIQVSASNTDSFGQVQGSRPAFAQLTVPTAPPSIVSAPANATVTAGGTASFTVLATGIPLPNTFAWGLGGSVIPATGGTVRIGTTAMACIATANFAAASSAPAGQVGQTLTLSNIGAGCDRAAVQVTAFSTLPGGGTLDASASARLTVIDPWVVPRVSLSPPTQSANVGGAVSFTVTASGTPEPGNFAWGLNAYVLTSGRISLGGCTANASFAPASAPSGQSAQTLTLSNLGPGCNNAQIVVTASNTDSFGQVQGSRPAFAQLMVIDPWVAPSVSLAPTTASSSAGGTVSFTATASGTPVPGNFVWGLNAYVITAGPISVGGCTANASIAAASAPSGQSAQTLTLSNLSTGCNTAQIAVAVSNFDSFGRLQNSRQATAQLYVIGPTSAAGACFGGPTGWCYVQPVPIAELLTGLVFDSTGNGLTIVGGSGVSLRSTDFAGTFTATWTPDRQLFTDLVSPSPAVLVSGAAYSGTARDGVYLSRDNGLSWTRTGSGFTVLSLAFMNTQIGIAVGYPGIARTTDGGQTWTLLNVPELNGNPPSAVAYAGNNTFVAVGPSPVRSTDGGLTWTALPGARVASSNPSGITFNGQGVGLIAGTGSAALLRSTDFGATWSSVSLPFATQRVAFADANTVVTLGTFSEISRSVDGGATWSPADYSLPGGQQQWRLAMRDAQQGLAVGNYGAIARTTDGGQSWTLVAGGTPDQTFNNAETNPSRTVLLAQGAGATQRSTNGRTWTRVYEAIGAGRGGLSWGSDTTAMASNFNGVQLSADGGNTWSLVRGPRGSGGNYYAVAMASAQIAVVAGIDVVNNVSQAFVERSTDGGQTWSTVNIPGFTGGTIVPYTARFISPNIGFLGGSDSSLWRTADGGASWTPVALPAGAVPYPSTSIQRVRGGPGNSVYVTTDSAVVRSTDGGLNWSVVFDSSMYGTMTDVSISNGGVGLAVGVVVARSADGGASWTRLDLPFGQLLNGVAWLANGDAVATGEGGTVLINSAQGQLAAHAGNRSFTQTLRLPAPAASRPGAPSSRGALGAAHKSVAAAKPGIGPSAKSSALAPIRKRIEGQWVITR